MNKIMFSPVQELLRLSLIMLSVLVLAPVSAEPADWEIDPEHFSIVFEADHIGYQQQLGFFLEAAGSFVYDTETQALGSGRIEITADSIFSNNNSRDRHLKSRDFLNARRHPVIVFEASDYTATSTESGVLNGALTMLGETHPVTVDIVINKLATYPFGHRKETLGVSASAVINRSQWGMDYGVGDNMVGDEVSLRFEFEAIRQ